MANLRAMRTNPAVASLLLATTAVALGGCPADPEPPIATADADAGAVTPDAVVTLPGQCADDDDCRHGTTLPACKAVGCVAGECLLSDLPDGTACDDGSPCTDDEVCASGSCESPSAPCDDGNPCTTDGCDPASGCVWTYNQVACDDGSSCTSSDRCFQGACVGEVLACDDLEPCTEDWCDPITGCRHAPLSGPCDDGDACTVGDTCAAGRCESGAPATCGNPDNLCQSASCDPDVGCLIEALAGECDDGNACTEQDICVDGVCAGALIDCDDGNLCTDDYCDPAMGCRTFDNVLPCDDGDVCTLEDTCAAGACVGGPDNPLCCEDVADCDDDDPCTTDSCGDDGLCRFAPLDCDDGAACTRDSCAQGICDNTPFGAIPDGPAPLADFDDATALDTWETTSTNDTVGWQRDTSDFFSGGASLYCGAIPEYSYDFGATVAVATATVTIPPGQSTLSLWAKTSFEENTSCTYDVLRVRIDDELLSPAVCASLATWSAQSWDVSTWAGRTVALTFEFDTLDDQANAGMGVWIDAVTLTTVSDLACCATAEECTGGGGGCLAETCDPASHQCAVPTGADACDDDDPCTTDSCQGDGTCRHEAIAGCP